MDKRASITEDPEIQAINKIAEALADLEEPARERVLRWAEARFTRCSAELSQLYDEPWLIEEGQDESHNRHQEQ